MGGKTIYLDSSCVVKRYVEEKASHLIDAVYGKAEMGEIEVSLSVWNIGEVFGVFDRYHQRRALTDSQFRRTLSNFASETTKISRLGHLNVMPISERQLLESWKILFTHHIYISDALQIATAKEAECAVFLSADGTLARIASKEGLEAANVEEETEKAKNTLSGLGVF